MNPFFFGDSAAPLFGAYHAPTGGAGREAVLICPPVGHEYLRAHRALRLLAESLASGGLHVLRFDYAGTGDSAGGTESMSVEAWLRSTTLAYEELRDVSGASRTTVVGLRLGAMLAAHALGRRPDVHALIAWDPVADGAAHLTELETSHRARLKSFEAGRGRRMNNAADATGTLMGFPYPPALREELRQLQLPIPASTPSNREPRVGIAASADRIEYRTLADACRARGAQVIHHVAPDAGNWDDFQSVGWVMKAPRISQAVAALVRGETP